LDASRQEGGNIFSGLVGSNNESIITDCLCRGSFNLARNSQL